MVSAHGLRRKTAGGHLPYSTLECKRGNTRWLCAHLPCANALMDRIQAVRLFIRVVDLGSFSKAAAEIGVGQPAATKQVAQLERGLGARLLHRSTHGVTPTEIGLLYYDKCKLIAHHVDEAESVATLMQTQLQGALRISSSVAFGRRVLVPLVMRFMQQNPRLRVELSFEDRYVDLVAQGIDVSIRMGRLADSSLGLRFLGVNPWVVVAAPAYLKAQGLPKRPADLKDHAALIYSSVQGDARWLFTDAKGKAQSIDVHGPLRSNNLSALLAAARHGLGVAALPRYVAQASLASGAVQAVLADWQLPAQEIHAVFPSPRLLPAKVSGFIDWLQPQLADAWWTALE
jgi:DNA-binding transcriptional LysR family regulator